MGSSSVYIVFEGQAELEFDEINRIVGEQRAQGMLNSPEQQLLKSIKQKVDVLKINPMYGDQVPRWQIPKDMPVKNLFVIDLVGYWRMLYTLERDQLQIVAFVLNIVDHPTYDKMFGYRKK